MSTRDLVGREEIEGLGYDRAGTHPASNDFEKWLL